MNFTEAVMEVIRITARPDKQVDAGVAINRAIASYTLLGDFRKDVIEATIAIDSTVYGDTISLSTLTNFRKFTYLKPTGARYYLKPLDADKIFTPKNEMQPNVYYIAGTNLTYTLSTRNSSLECGYMAYPILLAGTDTHWMLSDMPYAITEMAASKIFQDTGDDPSSARFSKSSMDFFLSIRRDLCLGD